MDRWTLAQVGVLRRHWREYGPPAHIGIACLAAAWGAKITSDPKPGATGKAKVIDLSEVAMDDVPMPVAGGDTMEASRAILAKLHAMHGG